VEKSRSAVVCIKCSAPLPNDAGPGRPASYCSLACRRAGAFEIRRATARLERLEDERAVLHVSLAGGGDLAPDLPVEGRRHWRSVWRRQLAALELEIARDEARLRELLAPGSDEESA
jgi:hypothetical protein